MNPDASESEMESGSEIGHGIVRQVVPTIDLKRAFYRHADEILLAVEQVLASGWYVGGEELRSFEREFAAYVGSAHALGVGSGTEALEIALRACGVGPGDLVATVSLTAAGTIAAIELVGATPVLVDIDSQRFTLDPALLEVVLGTYPIRAIIPVHLYGQPADIKRIVDLAARNGVYVIEDCAQAHGAAVEGKKCGTWGNIGAFSFYPTKNLGALGDGGAVVTDDPDLAERAGLLREYGCREHLVCEIPGMNSRLDAIQAAVLRIRLQYLEIGNNRRREIASRYGEALRETEIASPGIVSDTTHVYHQYVVRASDRDALKEHLARNGIQTAIHYPQPIHLQPAYLGRVPIHERQLPRTEQACRQILSLPCFPELTDREVDAVVQSLLSYASGRRATDSTSILGGQDPC